jgi:arabinogalactan endo-1,4-beta-galactosidase
MAMEEIRMARMSKEEQARREGMAYALRFAREKGVEEDCIKILKDHGMNTIRLRTWVNPSDDKASGHCSKDETVAMALRAQKMGMANSPSDMRAHR